MPQAQVAFILGMPAIHPKQDVEISMKIKSIKWSIYLFSLRQFYFHFWVLFSILTSYQQYLQQCYRNEHLHQRPIRCERSPNHWPIHLKKTIQLLRIMFHKLSKIPQFYLISWCENFVERHCFMPFHKISTPGN